MNFNEITKEREAIVADKFRKYGKGVQMGRYAASIGANGPNLAKWEDLIDPKMYSVSDIKNKMIEVGQRLNNIVKDDILGNMSVAFNHITEREDLVEFTWEEIYIFLRSALRYRQETEEYKDKKRTLQELESFIDANKSKSEKLKEARRKAEALKKEIG